MTDLSKIQTKELPISTMTEDEFKKHCEKYQEQLANWLEVIEYLRIAQHTKVWHEQVGDLMKKFTITNKNK